MLKEEKKAREMIDTFSADEDYPIYIETYHDYIVRGG